VWSTISTADELKKTMHGVSAAQQSGSDGDDDDGVPEAGHPENRFIPGRFRAQAD
jgi:hypothetical protein